MLFFVAAANADVWRWTDQHGIAHFVDSIRPIYTWVDDYGKVHFADKPGHEDAVSVELIWHSTGTLDEAEQEETGKGGEGFAFPGESEAERNERMQAEAYYCKRATEIYESYVNAPRLYKTNSAGEREYLSDEEAANTLAETKDRVDDLCG